MKLSGAEAARFAETPAAGTAAVLITGPDAVAVAEARRTLVRAVTEGDAMRLTRVEAQAAQKDAALLEAEVRARGFFPGRRVVLIEGAAGDLAGAVERALADPDPGDAMIVVEAAGLDRKTRLSKAFESGRGRVLLTAGGAGLDAESLASALRAHGLARPADDALARLEALATDLGEAATTALLRTLALYRADAPDTPLTEDEVEALAPALGDVLLDRLADAVVAGRRGEAATLFQRATASGRTPVSVMMRVGQHLRKLAAFATFPGSREAATVLKPPAFGPGAAGLAQLAKAWSPERLEAALADIAETERQMRSPGRRPIAALAERCCLRLASRAP